MFNQIEKYTSAIIFSTIQVAGLIFIHRYKLEGMDKYIIASFIFIAISIIIQLINHLYLNQKFVMNGLFKPKVGSASYLAQHYILPIWLQVLACIFFFIYDLNESSALSLIFTVILFLSLFATYVNLLKYYENQTLIEQRTHHLYDVIKFVILTVSTNIYLSMYFTFNQELTFILVLISITAYFIFYLIAHRNYFSDNQILISILFYVLLYTGIIYYLITSYHFDNFSCNIFSIGYFYFIIALLQHQITKTIRIKLVLEYILWLAMLMIIVWGLR